MEWDHPRHAPLDEVLGDEEIGLPYRVICLHVRNVRTIMNDDMGAAEEMIDSRL